MQVYRDVEHFRRAFPSWTLSALFKCAYTPLHTASYLGSEEVCAWLLSDDCRCVWKNMTAVRAASVVTDSVFFALCGGRTSVSMCKRMLEFGAVIVATRLRSHFGSNAACTVSDLLSSLYRRCNNAFVNRFWYLTNAHAVVPAKGGFCPIR